MNTTANLPGVYFTIATAGHVDHGKTSLISVLTGTNPDRLKEEQERQMTTDLGFAHLILAAEDQARTFGIGFIDVPGHGKFLKNMLAGVGGIELALLVVASDEGPMPQTVQHLKILSLLGVRSAVVALTKVDLADPARCTVVERKVRTLLERFSIDIVGLQFVTTVDGASGRGINELKSTLAQALSKINRKSVNEAVAITPGYLPIDRVFAKSGYGTVVTGTLVEGSFKVGDQVTVEPGALAARIRGLETFGQALEQARAGQRLAINLTAKDQKLNLVRGLCVLGGNKNVSADLILQIYDFGAENDIDDSTARKSKLSPKPIKLYHGTMEAAGALRWLEAAAVTNSPGAGEPEAMTRAGFSIGHVHLKEPIVVSPGDRYVLRYGDDGIAGGVVLLCQKPRWLTRKSLTELSPLLIALDFDNALLFCLDRHPGKAVERDDLKWLMRSAYLDDSLKRLQNGGKIENINGLFISPAVKQNIKDKIVSIFNLQLQNKDATTAGVNLETVRRLVAPQLDRRVMHEIIRELDQAKILVRKDDKLFSPSSTGAASADLDDYTNSILAVLKGVLCLELTELARITGGDLKKVKLALDKLTRHNLALVINYDFASSKEAVEDAHRKLLKIWQAKKDISPADFRDELATTRKYALALLAYFDDHQITRRTQNGRALLKQPK